MPDVAGRLTAALGDRYRLERELGAGGMATVYLAEDLKHHRQVVLKGRIDGAFVGRWDGLDFSHAELPP